MSRRHHATRRDFILAGSVSLGGALAALSASPAFAVVARQTSPALTTAGAANFEALVRALALAPGTHVRADKAPGARAAFATAFASTDDDSQRKIAMVLDEMDTYTAQDRFAAQSDRASYQQLRRMHAARTDAELQFEQGAAELAIGRERFADSPAGVQDYLLERSTEIKRTQRQFKGVAGTDVAALDPTTGLPVVQSPRPTDAPTPPLDVTSDAFLQRSLAAAALSLVGTFFYPPKSDGPPL
ncbi:MAG: hypothetical protein QOJ85_3861 [Solirubrobacteraceae bacterium]|jgi:hypothetical protein|nr:hypothetical protein [Solirubrobacteraceae bacterium]MEA2240680.1 hypothetical protein [Solirubrobacteraceae bacterium]